MFNILGFYLFFCPGWVKFNDKDVHSAIAGPKFRSHAISSIVGLSTFSRSYIYNAHPRVFISFYYSSNKNKIYDCIYDFFNKNIINWITYFNLYAFLSLFLDNKFVLPILYFYLSHHVGIF